MRFLKLGAFVILVLLAIVAGCYISIETWLLAVIVTSGGCVIIEIAKTKFWRRWRRYNKV